MRFCRHHQLAETNKRIERLTDDRKDLRTKRDKPASSYNPKCEDAVGDDHPSDDAGCRQFRLREGLCGVARPHAQTALHRRQAEDGPDLEDGQPLYPTLAVGAMAQIMLRRRLKSEPGSDWLSSMLIGRRRRPSPWLWRIAWQDQSSPSSGTDRATSNRQPDRLSRNGQGRVR
jgi:transposase